MWWKSLVKIFVFNKQIEIQKIFIILNIVNKIIILISPIIRSQNIIDKFKSINNFAVYAMFAASGDPVACIM